MVSTKSKANPYNYGVKPEPPREAPVSSRRERAIQLPNSGPGIGVKVSLELLPDYLELHGLEPILAAFPPITSASVPLVVKVVRRKKVSAKEKVNHE